MERRKRWLGKETWTEDVWNGRWNQVNRQKYPAHAGERWEPGACMFLDTHKGCALPDVLQLAMNVTKVALVRWGG